MTRVVIGSRGSELALTQANYIAERIRSVEPGIEVEVLIISTKGDRITDVPLSQVGGKGLFTKELEVALLEKEIDLAVHSLKDLPTELPGGLTVGAIPGRENPADALISASGLGLMALPQGAKVGTSSTRRQVQLKAMRPDLELVDLRGNVPTRLAKLETEGLDAIILAAAGLNRLGLSAHITELLAPEIMLSAVGQGALGIEIRDDDAPMKELLGRLHDRDTARAATAERALLSAMGGGCQVPLGALAVVEGEVLHLRACACSPDGTQVVRAERSGPADEPEALGRAVAQTLIEGGASAFLRQVALEALRPKQPLAGRTVVVTRAESQGSVLSDELAALGATVVDFPAIAIHGRTPAEPIPADDAVDWLIFTSANGVEHFASALVQAGRSLAAFRGAAVCAIGPATAAALRALGVPVTLTPERYIAESILEGLVRLEGGVSGKRFLMPRGNLARPDLPAALRNAGAEVVECVVYETSMPTVEPATVEAMLGSSPNMVVFTSSSTARNFAAILGESRLADLKAAVTFASIGPITTETANALGMTVTIEPAEHEIPALVYAIVEGPDTPRP
jgi:hydroxymethylbilane synthase